MKLTYLGTAAAEGVPGIFCECDNCRKSRAAGGRNIRTRSQSLVDDRLLIDFPADTYMHFLNYNLPLTRIKHCLITHAHQDHLYAEELAMRAKWFCEIHEDPSPLTFYSDIAGCDMLNDMKEKKHLTDAEIVVRRIPLNEPFTVDRYTVTALRANHDPASSPVVYIIEGDGKTLFYSNDTGEYPEESMAYLRGLSKPFDTVSFDCTSACSHSNYAGHFSFERCVAMRRQFVEMGIADEHTAFVLTHFSHNGDKAMYDEFVPIAAQEGFVVAYDGMEIEI